MVQRMDVLDDVLLDPECIFIFPTPEMMSPPVLKIDNADIGYSASNILLKKVNMNIDLETRICLIGPNGAGKSTLLKVMQG